MTESTTETKTETTTVKRKPMTVTERKALMTLIDNDFAVLRNEVAQYASEMLATEERRIREEFAEAEQRAVAIHDEWRALQRELSDRVSAFMQIQREAGFFPKILSTGYREEGGYIRYGQIEFQVRARDAALTEMRNQIDRQKMSALNELDRQKIQTQREVLTSALVTEEARDLLDKQPDPRTLLENAVNGSDRMRAITMAAQQVVAVPPVVPAIDAQAVPGEVVIPEVMDR